MIYLQIFIEFFKTGLFAIGGGLATLPFLYDIAEKFPAWYSTADLANMIAVSESTPGPIGINMATFAGYQASGVLGSFVATMAVVLPSMIIVLIVARFLEKFNNHPVVQSVFYGLRPAVCGLIATAGAQVVKISLLNTERFEASRRILDLFSWKAMLLFVILYLGITKTKKHPVWFLAIGAVVGILFKF
ncbi:chromate transporter [Acidaminobacterium chupaoyuni]